MANEISHGERPLDANLPTELAKTFACFDRFPLGTSIYMVSIPTHGDRPTFSAIDYADSATGGIIALYRSGDMHDATSVRVAVNRSSEPMGLPVTRYGESLELADDLQSLKFMDYTLAFRDKQPTTIVGSRAGGSSMIVPDIGCTVFPGERLSENHYFYYVMRFILGKVSKAKPGLHVSLNGIVSSLDMVSE